MNFFSSTFDLKSQSIPATSGGGSFKGVFGDDEGSRRLLPSGPDAASKCEEAERKLVN
ncbi:hypothetical protein HanRHA438_Chr10g0479631 [Helianthus annuus]|nr:hypothetical protein HanRHA438_Chr10g0479631 [Helianthus annuus]